MVLPSLSRSGVSAGKEALCPASMAGEPSFSRNPSSFGKPFVVGAIGVIYVYEQWICGKGTCIARPSLKNVGCEIDGILGIRVAGELRCDRFFQDDSFPRITINAMPFAPIG